MPGQLCRGLGEAEVAIELKGPWDAGFAVDVHTESSKFVGNGPFGPEFDTKHSAVGLALHRLKYHRDDSGLHVVVSGLKLVYDKRIVPRLGYAHWVIPVPPNEPRTTQPLYIIITDEFCCLTKIADGRDLLVKTRETPTLKDVQDPKIREELLAGAFVASAEVRGKHVLVLDDIYRSGATAREIARTIKDQRASAVCLLTVTRTRIRR